MGGYNASVGEKQWTADEVVFFETENGLKGKGTALPSCHPGVACGGSVV